MHRRAFLRALGIGAAAVVAAPVLAQLPKPAPVVIRQRKVLTRIRVTQELIDDAMFGIPAADWIHDGATRTYMGIARSWE